MPTDGDDVYYGDSSESEFVNLQLGNDIAYISSGRMRILSGSYYDEFEDYGRDDWDILYADFSEAQSGLSSYTVFFYEDYPDVFFGNHGFFIHTGSDWTESTHRIAAENFDELHIIGSRFDDQFVGGRSDDYFYGGEGVDRFSPYIGDDVVDGGPGSDWLVLDFGPYVEHGDDELGPGRGATLDLSLESAQTLASMRYFTDAGSIVVRSIENIEGTAFEDDFVGNNSANQLLGMGGNDRLVGDAGNDLLDGGTGVDLMRGGAGNDSYYVDDPNDVAFELAGEGSDTVYSSVSFALRSNIENITITGSAVRAAGNNLGNRLIGTDGNNVLNGGTGADSLRGGAGSDLYYVDNVGDRIVENVGEGNDRVYSTVTYSLALNVEQIFLRGSAAIDANGNGLDNVLVGNSAANILNGRLGADTLRGAGGADWFIFDDADFGGLTASTADRIVDFSHAERDRIDLRRVDADGTAEGDQIFAFIGTSAFTQTPGELRYEQSGSNTFVYGDTDGDGTADFMIRLDGSHSLVGADFIL